MVALLRRNAFRLALVVCLCLTLSLSACSGSGTGLSGSYVDDTVLTARTLLSTIALPQEDAGRAAAETQARALINDWTSRYRPRADIRSLTSFTTMQTAVNSLAGHYANYANRPLPDDLRTRLENELKRAETIAGRGA
ncbi:MAG: photosystem II protein Psb27 [Cyanobium sp.]